MSMIDIKLIRDSPDLVKKNIKKKFQDEKLPLVDKIKKKDEDWRKLKSQADKLRHDRNKVSIEISKAKKEGKSTTALMKQARSIPDQIAKIEINSKKLQLEIFESMLQIPNMMHDSVPKGKTAEDNPVLRKSGKPKKPKFEIKNHADLIEDLKLADFEAGRKNSGGGFNYLLGDMALLDLALQRYGLDFVMKKGFTPVIPPMLLNHDTLQKVLNGLEDFEEVVFKIENEDLHLIGTAEHPLASMHKNKILLKRDLPIKLCAVTPCFRKEIGSHGVDTKGLYRMHQFNKVEQVIFCTAEESAKFLEEMQSITEEFIKSLEIPFQVVEICSGDLGAKFAKQYDIEAWFPRQKAYGEITSAGTCTDYQARALNTKYIEGTEKKYPHILNNTMIATSRAMVMILENFQNKDGSVDIPKVLQPYMNGKKKIEKNK